VEGAMLLPEGQIQRSFGAALDGRTETI